jgi:DNA-binding PucR family transcriptional regulator
MCAQAAEASGGAASIAAVLEMRVIQEALLERLTTAVEREYVRERNRMDRAPERRRREIVNDLLSGEMVDANRLLALSYEIHSTWHVGLFASGSGIPDLFQALKRRYDRRLTVAASDQTGWAWLGGGRRDVGSGIEQVVGHLAGAIQLGIGEPGNGMEGWRLTHNQARDALQMAWRASQRIARYGDNRLLAGVLSSATLMESLKETYLKPLRSQRDGGAALRDTLRTYIRLECNASASAHALKVSRRTVTSRVRTAEELIGTPLNRCWTEVDVALRLEGLSK